MAHRLIWKSKMSIEPESRRQGTGTRSIAPLSDETRRHILRVLHENAGVTPIECLAERLIADSEDLDTTDTESLQVRLHHVHLPKLADYGFINWDKQEQTVSTPNRSVHETAGFHERTMNDSEGTAREFTDDRLHAVLAIIEYEQESISREALARRLAQQEFDGQATESQIENIGVELHHKHLPKLAETGLIEYNADDGTAEYLESVESTADLL